MELLLPMRGQYFKDILRKCKQSTMPSINGPLLAQKIRDQVGTRILLQTAQNIAIFQQTQNKTRDEHIGHRSCLIECLSFKSFLLQFDVFVVLLIHQLIAWIKYKIILIEWCPTYLICMTNIVCVVYLKTFFTLYKFRIRYTFKKYT